MSNQIDIAAPASTIFTHVPPCTHQRASPSESNNVMSTICSLGANSCQPKSVLNLQGPGPLSQKAANQQLDMMPLCKQWLSLAACNTSDQSRVSNNPDSYGGSSDSSNLPEIIPPSSLAKELLRMSLTSCMTA